MKQIQILKLLIIWMSTIWTVVIWASPIFAGQTGQLIIHIQGFDHSDGVAKVSLVNSKKNFSDPTPYKGFNFKIINKIVLQKTTLPYGEYALKVFHDENSNNELDTQVFDIPLEPYGFSNNAKGVYGPPDFEDASFVIDSDKKEIFLKLN